MKKNKIAKNMQKNNDDINNSFFKSHPKFANICKYVLLPFSISALLSGIIGVSIINSNLHKDLTNAINTPKLIRFKPTNIQQNSTQVIKNTNTNPYINYYNLLINSGIYTNNVLGIDEQTAYSTFIDYWNKQNSTFKLGFIANSVYNYANYVINQTKINNTSLTNQTIVINNETYTENMWLQSISITQTGTNNYNIDVKTNISFAWLNNNTLYRNIAIASLDYVFSNVSFIPTIINISNKFYGGVSINLNTNPITCLVVSNFLKSDLITNNNASIIQTAYDNLTKHTLNSYSTTLSMWPFSVFYNNATSNDVLFLMPLNSSYYWIMR